MSSCRLLLVIVAVARSLAASDSDGGVLTPDPGFPDTAYVDSLHVIMPEPVVLPVGFYNDGPLSAIEITLVLRSPCFMIDSFSFADGRVSHIDIKGITVHDSGATIFVFQSDEPAIAAGRGSLGTLFLSYPDSTPPQLVTIDTITVTVDLVERGTFFTLATNPVTSFIPQFKSGFVSLQTTCCYGTTGNTDQSPDNIVDIGDVTELINYLFVVPDKELVCPEEADIDGSSDGVVDIGDLTRLICWLFIDAGACTPAPCP